MVMQEFQEAIEIQQTRVEIALVRATGTWRNLVGILKL